MDPTPEQIKKTQDIIRIWADLDLTEDQARTLLQEPRVAAAVTAGGFSNMETKETMAKVLAETIVGRPWPTYGNGEESAATFFRELTANALTKGYKVLPRH